MAYKSRAKSTELLIMESLDKRMGLSNKEKQYFYNLQKGYEGEVMFDSLTEKLQCECLILNDLLFKINNTTFQIDSLIIISNTIYLFEVKNFEGDYYFDSDKIYSRSNTEIQNPLNQLSRAETLFRHLLQSIGFDLSIEASVVFINPEFTLYQSPINKPIIYPTQINRYLQRLDSIPLKLTSKQKILADKLISLHIKDSPLRELPSYNYDQLQKGITCLVCGSLSVSIEGSKCVCTKCGHEEKVSNAVMRSVQEFKLLFPDQKITTNVIHDWCTVVQSKKQIRRILEKNLKMVKLSRWSYYE